MVETELIKVAINFGSFAVVVILVIHHLFRGEPNNRKMIEKITEDNREAIKNMCESYERIISNLTKECREERREDKILIEKQGELDRVSRHDQAKLLQDCVIEMHELVLSIKQGMHTQGSARKPT